MARMLLLVGTRKGCFVLEGGEDRRQMEAPRPVLRGLAGLPRNLRPRLGLDLRRGCKRVARLRGVAKL